MSPDLLDWIQGTRLWRQHNRLKMLLKDRLDCLRFVRRVSVEDDVRLLGKIWLECLYYLL